MRQRRSGWQRTALPPAPADVKCRIKHRQLADEALAELSDSTADGGLPAWPTLARPAPPARNIKRWTCQPTGAAPALMQQHCRALCRIFNRHSFKSQHPIGTSLTNSLCRTVPEGFTVLREGKGAILRKGNDVFYNPAQARLSDEHSA